MIHRQFLWRLLCCLINFAAIAITRAPCQENSPAKEEVGAKGITVRVAAISFRPKKFDLAGNADKLEIAFRQAKRGGAEIAVGPEGSLEGYVVNEIIAGECDARKMLDVAIPIDHAVIQRFQQLSDELKLCLVFGFAERIGDDVFNSAVFIDHNGRICGKYHKMQLAEGYDPAWWFNRLGSSSRAFDTPYGRCGLLICNDRRNAALAQILVLDGARFLLIPAFGSNKISQDDVVLSRGLEQGIPVVEANVGVTLIVNNGKIATVDRREDAITFGEITIPPPTASQPERRDKVEQRFLKWREQEMQRRLEKTHKKLRSKTMKQTAH